MVNADTTLVTLTWTTRLSRRYIIESRTDLVTASWDESTSEVIPPDSDITTTRDIAEETAPKRFYRIRAIRPLAP